MSVWADIHKRSNGTTVRKEDLTQGYDPILEERMKKYEEERKIEVAKAEKEQRFLDIWDNICLAMVIIMIFSAVVTIICVLMYGNYLPIWPMVIFCSSAFASMVMSIGGMYFNDMRSHIRKYLK